MATVDEFKHGVASMSTRPFGEAFAEEMLVRLYGFTRVGGTHDLQDGRTRIEVKYSRIYAPQVASADAVSKIVNYGGKTLGSMTAPFCANFQKLHPHEYDVIFYGIVFSEGVLLHKARSNEVRYLNQHLNNTDMKQFSINQRSLASHSDYKIELFDWQSILRIFS